MDNEIKIGTTRHGAGFDIFRVPNKIIGGWDYVHEYYGTVINSMHVDIGVLEMILADLRGLIKGSDNGQDLFSAR